MKKTKMLSIILTILSVIGIPILFYLDHKNIDIDYAFWGTAYILVIILFIVYHFIFFILNLRRLKRHEFKTRLMSFIKGFAFYSILGIVFQYYFKEEIDFLHVLSISFGTAAGMSFLDLSSPK